MRKFSKVEQVFVETMDASSPSLTKKAVDTDCNLVG